MTTLRFAVLLSLTTALTALTAHAADSCDTCPGVPVDPGTINPVPPPQCSATCTSTSDCNTACTNGGETSCGAFGVCQQCAAVCTGNARCDSMCVENGQLGSCRTTARTCQTCSAATCEGLSCGAYCMNPPSFGKCAVRNLDGSCRNTYSQCDASPTMSSDRDADGLTEELEQRLAVRFFPAIHQSADSQHQFYGLNFDTWGTPTLCNGNADCRMPYLVRRVGRLYGARQGWCAENQCLELSYGMPYNWDLGQWFGGEHRGDAEFVSILITYSSPTGWAPGWPTWDEAKQDPTKWHIIGMFYAAHLCTDVPYGDSSRFVFPTNVDQRFVVWASNSKNGSYPTFDSCDEGALYQDWCGGGGWVDVSQSIPKLFNVGERDTSGYVCSGFNRQIALPEYRSSTPRRTIDVWGDVKFDTTTAWKNVFARNFLNWGTAQWHCW
ncbi:MAG: hypothetical protein QM817_29960 [Archangium sp.]